MYNTLLRLYLGGKLTVHGLTNAVIEKWITDEEKQRIMASKINKGEVNESGQNYGVI